MATEHRFVGESTNVKPWNGSRMLNNNFWDMSSQMLAVVGHCGEWQMESVTSMDTRL